MISAEMVAVYSMESSGRYSDGIWLPFRPAVYFPTQFKPEEVELIMPKNRGGQACSVDLKWDGPSMAFSSTNSGDDFNPGEHF